jgi:hydroxymethylpyrimidine/phosphomethylpyrimidine kinase
MSSAPPAAPPAVLTFAASDPTGGAGLQADLLTIAALGCHPLCVVTALTVQDTRGVERVMPMQPAWIAEQARCVLEDIEVAAFKAGVLGSAQNVRVVSELVAEYGEVPLVVDPVLASGRGDPLAEHDAIEALRELILPRTTVLTPNSLEARRLADGATDLAECARRLLDHGCDYVLITGTHEDTSEVINTLYDESGVVREDRWPRLPASYHGSGCTLASALAAHLARGLEPAEAAREAQQFTWAALAAGFKPGAGQFLPNRFFGR